MVGVDVEEGISGIGIDLSGFNAYEQETSTTMLSFLNKFVDLTFTRLKEPIELKMTGGSGMGGNLSVSGMWNIGGVELKLSYEKNGESPVLSISMDGVEGRKELARAIIRMTRKQKEIIEKIGRMYPIERLMKIIEIDTNSFVNEKSMVFDERGHMKRKKRSDVILSVHRELMKKALKYNARRTDCDTIKEHSNLKIDCSNIATEWEMNDVHDTNISLISRVVVIGALPKQVLYAIIASKDIKGIGALEKALVGVERAKKEIEPHSILEVTGEKRDSAPIKAPPQIDPKLQILEKRMKRRPLGRFFQQIRNGRRTKTANGLVRGTLKN